MLIEALCPTLKHQQSWLLTIFATFGLLGLAGCSKDKPRATGTGKGVLQALDKRSAAVERATAKKRGKNRAGTRGNAGKRDPAKPPMDIAQPPKDAQRTASGISYKVLKEASGGRAPAANDTAQVHYRAWKTTGEVIYSTYRDGKPQPMPLYQAPPGWREMVRDMRVGERRLCWMPGHLASAVQAKATAMTLVFDMEVLATHSPPPTPERLDEPPADATRTASGLAYEVLRPAAGDADAIKTPEAWDEVEVHFTTWRQNGVVQRDTTFQKRPLKLRPVDAAGGFAEAVSLMGAGQRNRVWIPQELRMPLRTGDAGGTHVMEIELFGWEDRVGPPPTPTDVAKPPADAMKTERGVFYKYLTKGKGTKNPESSSTVRVHYTGWTTDGKMFDSSRMAGKPMQFSLGEVIRGWTDIVQVMVVGDTIRTWIPEKLAYQGKPGRPAGMLVFEIELLMIVE